MSSGITTCTVTQSQNVLQFLNKNAQFKNILFSTKYPPKKLISRYNEQPNTLLTRQEYKGKIYVKNIRKNSCRIRNQLKSRIWIRKKIIPEPQHCFFIWITVVRYGSYLHFFELVKPNQQKSVKKAKNVLYLESLSQKYPDSCNLMHT